ncbi:glutamate racemase [Kordiimonas laminariae]|uniref:glutamate racemase n=1 Tax=Kordiimonas laminariae TaxID=2917717 RepID=UPI001FF265B1|nr:glutamate racemase [Kordiimonas laminariae]MCK0068365.1 glutamate racemase [Kordiimonas laminariae]
MIGVFDSGSGGITVLDALTKRLPDQDFLYLGDHANAPYGHRTSEQIVEMTKTSVDYLMREGCSLVLLACNTAAAVALRTLQQNWLETAYPGNRILGVLVPMVEALTGVPWSQERPHADDNRNHRITLFATRKTIESGAYVEEVLKRAPQIKLTGKACPGLVDAIEGGAGDAPLSGLISGFVSETLETNPDAVVLGCTHFPLVKHYFETALPDHVSLYSQPEIVADSLADYLKRHPHFHSKGQGNIRLLTTGDPKAVNKTNLFLPNHLNQFHQAKLNV